MTTDDQRSIDSAREPVAFGQFSQTESLRWRSRSLSELPGHLRVPVLKRKEPERMRARMAAAAAGLAELRQLREKHTAMVLHTVASSGGTTRRKSTGLVGSKDGGYCYRRMSTDGQISAKDRLKYDPLDLNQSTDPTNRLHTYQRDSIDKRTVQSPYIRHSNGEKCLSSHDLSYSDPRYVEVKERRPSTHKRAASVDIPLTQGLEDSRGRLSWENLLSLVGLQSADKFQEFDENSDSVTTTNDDNVFDSREMVNSVDDTESHTTCERRERLPVKAGRSQSFCFGHAPSLAVENTRGKGPELRDHVTNGFGYMKENTTPQTENTAIVEAPAATHRPVNKATAILRRASIQCESVLTGNAGPVLKRKVLNPLHEIDLEALRSPGPLHAVTLQYSRMQSRVQLNGGVDKQTPVRGRSASVDYQATRQLLPNNMEDPKFPHPAARHHSWGNKQLQPIFEDSNVRTEPRGDHQEGDVTSSDASCTRNSLVEFVENEITVEILSPDLKKLSETDGNVDAKVSVIEENEDRASCEKDDTELIQISERCGASDLLNSPIKDNEILPSGEIRGETYKDLSLYQPDTSVIFSDDGYSTCESMSQTSRHTASTAGSKRSSSDWSSLSSGSVSNISLSSAFNHPGTHSRRASLSCISKLRKSPKTCDMLKFSPELEHGTANPSQQTPFRAMSSAPSESLSIPSPQPYFTPSPSIDRQPPTSTNDTTRCETASSTDKDTDSHEYVVHEGKYTKNMSVSQSTCCENKDTSFHHGAKNPIITAEEPDSTNRGQDINASMTAVIASSTPSVRADVQPGSNSKNFSPASNSYNSPRCMNAELGTPSSYRYKGYPTTRYSVKVNKGVKQTAV